MSEPASPRHGVTIPLGLALGAVGVISSAIFVELWTGNARMVRIETNQENEKSTRVDALTKSDLDGRLRTIHDALRGELLTTKYRCAAFPQRGWFHECTPESGR